MSYMNFIFKGHDYSFGDRAENQGVCPHCGKQSKNFFWELYDDAFIGVYYHNKLSVMCCFECPKCFKKFFYHQSRESIEELLKNAEYIRRERR